jgi:SAM-dependent methyltransferase
MTSCRGCGEAALDLVLSLGAMPPVNAFLTADEIVSEESFPLDLYFCGRCTLVQLHPTVDPRRLFTNYAYLSSASRTTAAYLAEVADQLAATLGLTQSSKILEIGSNDGTLLRRLQRITPHVLGVDPARNVAAIAAAAGVRTLVEFFSSRTAVAVRSDSGLFDLVVASNVVAHTPDLVDLLEGVRSLLGPHGTFVMECAYVRETVLRGEIDTVYHEHVYCFSLHALNHVLARAGLTIVDVQQTPAQGGSLRVFARASSEDAPVQGSVPELLREEREGGLCRFETYAVVARLADQLRQEVRARVRGLRRSSGMVVGLGASARGVVLMNHCGLTVDDLDFVVDDTPLKQGKLVPGCHIPVHDWSRIPAGREIGAVMLSWNYRAEILAKLRARTSHARILIPLPTLEEITLGS